MTTQQIRMFLEAARCRSFTEAAKHLFLSQSTISKQIAAMEEELGFTLFIRKRNALQLTSAGALFHKELAKIEINLNTAIIHAQKRNYAATGHLDVTVLDVIDPRAFLSHALEFFEKEFPSVEVEVSFCGFNQLMERYRAQETDIVITKRFHFFGENGCSSLPLYPVNQSIVVSGKHPLAKEHSVQLSQLKDENFVVLELTECPSHINSLIDMCAKEGFYPKISKYASSNTARIFYVSQGHGVTLMDRELPVPSWADVVLLECATSPETAEEIGVEMFWRNTTDNDSVFLFVHSAQQYLQNRRELREKNLL